MGGKGPYLFQQALNALQLAGFYLPLALAFSMIQAITGRVFLSFGNVAMYGSFAAVYACFGFLLQGFEDLQAALLALVVALVCSSCLGVAASKMVFLPLAKSSALAFMIGSLGFAIVLEEVMRLTTGAQDIWVPPLFAGQRLSLIEGSFPVRVTGANILGLCVSVVAVAATFLLMTKTRFGRTYRACTENIALARLCGVNTDHIFMATFALGSALAALAGWISAIIYGGTNFSVGLMLGLKAMFASVAGGEGSLRGALSGALALAALETAWAASFGSSYRDVGVFALVIFLLLLRQGRRDLLADDGGKL